MVKRSRILSEVRSTAASMYRAGIIDSKSMREFDTLTLPQLRDLSPKQIRTLRARTGMSQAAFAAFLNTSVSTVQKWEITLTTQPTAAPTFTQMVESMAAEDPFAVVLGWWRRVEKALTYYTVAFHVQQLPTAFKSIRQLEADGHIDRATIERLDILRKIRNGVAHGGAIMLAEEAVRYATDALDLIGIIGASLPDELALSSGAGRFA